MSRPVVLALALAAAGAVLFLWPREPKNPEDQIRALVAECVQLANDKAVNDLMDHLAEEFVGPQGTRKQDVKQTLTFQLLRNQEVAVILNPTLNVEVKGDTAGAFTGFFVFARTKVQSADELNPAGVAAVYKIEADLERKDGRWTIVGAQYQRVSGW